VCEALADRLANSVMRVTVAGGSGSVTSLGADSCTFKNLELDSGHIAGWTADRVTLTSPGIAASTPGSIPKVLRADITGIRFSVRVDDSHARYLNAAVQRPFDIHLNYEWDDEAHQLHVREATLESPWIGRTSLSADLDVGGSKDGFNGRIQDRGITLRRVHFVLDNRAIVEAMMLPALVGSLPKDKDPAVEFPKIQRLIEKEVRALPASGANEASKDALIRFVRDFPHPTGHFEETVTFDQPISLDELTTDKKGRWLRKARIEAAYSPTPAAPAS